MKKSLLYIAVFVCGGAVLSIEIIGTRIIGPFYGVSIYLWSALISVTLIALSVGYIVGGRFADKKNNFRYLAGIIIIAGAFTLCIPFIRDAVLEFTQTLGLRAAVLISTFILFFLPLTLLGMVSPFAIKLRTESLDKIGTRAGDIYSYSTIGSVLAALVTGFILIPNIGVIKLTLSIGIILIATGVLIIFINISKSMKVLSAIILISLVISVLSFSPSEKSDPKKGVIAIKQSEYGEIRVMDIDENRFLLIDGGIHCAINKKTKESILPYVWVLNVVKKLKDYSGDMLLIGWGGGSVAKSFYDDNWDVEVAELDPTVKEISEKYFNVIPSFDNIKIEDGRKYLKFTDHTFDLIILDAFGSSSIPFQLTSLESFWLAKNRLKKEGIFALNVEAMGWNDIIVRSLAKTLKQVFNYVLALPIAEPPDQMGNIIIIASNKPLKLTEELERNYNISNYRFSASYEMNHAWDNRFVPDMQNALVLTDDLNPSDIWAERINFQARKELHKYLGDYSFLW